MNKKCQKPTLERSRSPDSPLDGGGSDVFINMYITVLQPQIQKIIAVLSGILHFDK